MPACKHVPVRQFEIVIPLSLSFLFSLLRIFFSVFPGPPGFVQITKDCFSLPLISDNQYKLTTLLTLISVIRYKDQVRLGLDILPGQFRLLYRLTDIRIGLDSRNKTYRRHVIFRVYKVGKGGIGQDKVSYCPSAVQSLL